MTDSNISKPIWEMDGAECDETASRIGYVLEQHPNDDGTRITTAICEATGDKVAPGAYGYDEKGKRPALALAAKIAGRHRVVDKRACVYLGEMPESNTESTTDEPGRLSEPASAMTDNELRGAAVAIGYRLDPYKESDYWVPRWYADGANYPDSTGGSPSLHGALYRSLQHAAKQAGRLRPDGTTYRVWLGPLPMPVTTTATQDAGQPEVKPATCKCGACQTRLGTGVWFYAGWKLPNGQFCPECGCLLGDGIAQDPQAAMRRVVARLAAFRRSGNVDDRDGLFSAIDEFRVPDTEGAPVVRTCWTCVRDTNTPACRQCGTGGNHQFWQGAKTPKGDETGE